jgi:hypothetical protein
MEEFFRDVFKNKYHIESYVRKEGVGQDSTGTDSSQFPADRDKQSLLAQRGIFLLERAGMEFQFPEHTLGIEGISKTRSCTKGTQFRFMEFNS